MRRNMQFTGGGGMQEVYHRRKTSRSRTIEEQPALKL